MDMCTKEDELFIDSHKRNVLPTFYPAWNEDFDCSIKLNEFIQILIMIKREWTVDYPIADATLSVANLASKLNGNQSGLSYWVC